MSDRQPCADILNLSLADPFRFRRERLKLHALLLLQQQRNLQQRQRLTEAVFVSRRACINKLRREQKRRQTKSVKEMNLLQQRLRMHQLKSIEEIRVLRQRHREHRVALLRCIEQRRIIQYLIGENVNRAQDTQEQTEHDGDQLSGEQEVPQQQPSKGAGAPEADAKVKESGQ